MSQQYHQLLIGHAHMQHARGMLRFTQAGTRCLNPRGLTGSSTHVRLSQDSSNPVCHLSPIASPLPGISSMTPQKLEMKRGLLRFGQ